MMNGNILLIKKNITEIYLFNQSNIGKNNYGYSIQNVDSLENGHTIITKDIFY